MTWLTTDGAPLKWDRSNVVRGPYLFGTTDAPIEAADVRPDLREVTTFAEELAHEYRVTAAIQADPFSHLPFAHKGDAFLTLKQIAGRQRAIFDTCSPQYRARRKTGSGPYISVQVAASRGRKVA